MNDVNTQVNIIADIIMMLLMMHEMYKDCLYNYSWSLGSNGPPEEFISAIQTMRSLDGRLGYWLTTHQWQGR